MLTLGAMLVCGALLAFAALTLVFRRPEPPRWTTRSGVGEVVTITLVAFLTLGMGYLAAGAVTAYQQDLEPIDFGLLIVVLGATVVAWRRLDVRRRLRADVAAGPAITHAGSALKLGIPANQQEQPVQPAPLRAA